MLIWPAISININKVILSTQLPTWNCKEGAGREGEGEKSANAFCQLWQAVNMQAHIKMHNNDNDNDNDAQRLFYKKIMCY